MDHANVRRFIKHFETKLAPTKVSFSKLSPLANNRSLASTVAFSGIVVLSKDLPKGYQECYEGYGERCSCNPLLSTSHGRCYI